jgi:hypothetical protein
VTDSSSNTHVSLLSYAECDAYLNDFTPQDAISPPCEPTAHNDSDLEVVVSAWEKLPSALKAGIVAMVKAADGVQ